MKNAFPSFKYAGAVRQLLKELPHQYFGSVMKEFLLRYEIPNDSLTPLADCMAAQANMLLGHGTHYFVESDVLATLLANMVEESSAPVLDVLAEDRQTALLIHIPSKAPVLVGIRTRREGTNAIFFESGTETVISLGTEDFSGGGVIPMRGWADRLAFGMALYLRYNPDALLDGVPDAVRDARHYHGTQHFRIIATDKLADDIKHHLSPHWRSHHYRTLRAERYGKNIGKQVEVRGCFVKGTCKTVVEVEGKQP